MRAHSGYAFSWILAGGTVQLLTGIALTGLAEMRLADNDDFAVDHTKIAVKLVLSVVIFIVALLGYLRQKKMTNTSTERTLLPLVHIAGALALANIVIAVVWPGRVPS
jgi:uncharacterized membrane protein YidH (DUF202 family)